MESMKPLFLSLSVSLSHFLPLPALHLGQLPADKESGLQPWLAHAHAAPAVRQLLAGFDQHIGTALNRSCSLVAVSKFHRG